MDRGLILHKSVNAKDFSAAKGCPLCKGKAAGSGDLCKTLRAAPIAVPCPEKSRLQGDGPRRPIFHQNPSQFGPSKPNQNPGPLEEIRRSEGLQSPSMRLARPWASSRTCRPRCPPLMKTRRFGEGRFLYRSRDRLSLPEGADAADVIAGEPLGVRRFHHARRLAVEGCGELLHAHLPVGGHDAADRLAVHLGHQCLKAHGKGLRRAPPPPAVRRVRRRDRSHSCER